MKDEGKLERFAAAQLSSLLRPAYYLTGDWDLAQDLVQTTLVKMCGAWDRLGPDVDHVAYARTVLLNVYRDHARSQRRRVFRRLPAPTPAAEVDLAERDYQRELLLQLPPKQRAVIVLRFLEDLNIQQTADCLGVTTGTVKSQTSERLMVRDCSRSLEIKGAVAQRLADDVNALRPDNSPLPQTCGPATVYLALTFHTSSGDTLFLDSCGFVRAIPTCDAPERLRQWQWQTSDAFNLDVNTAFASLLPTPLASSAPLPARPPDKGADQVITDAPARVSIETIQAVSKGKQRMTDQTST